MSTRRGRTTRPRTKATAAAMPPARVTIAYSAPCPNCGHRRRTEYVGLPADVIATLRGGFDRSGLTKAELHRRLGMRSRGYFDKLLSGVARPSQPVARDLAVVLGLTWVEGEQLLAASGGEHDRRQGRGATS